MCLIDSSVVNPFLIKYAAKTDPVLPTPARQCTNKVKLSSKQLIIKSTHSLNWSIEGREWSTIGICLKIIFLFNNTSEGREDVVRVNIALTSLSIKNDSAFFELIKPVGIKK